MTDPQQIINDHMKMVGSRVLDVFENADEDATADDIMQDVFMAVGIVQAYMDSPKPEEDLVDRLFQTISDRLGEHERFYVQEIADSGEYESFLRGNLSVEHLAEWIVPAVIPAARQYIEDNRDETP